MPLGKLSKKQIHAAYEVLTRLRDHITAEGEEVDQKMVISCTNEFYSLIPHHFGAEEPPLLNTLTAIEVTMSRV